MDAQSKPTESLWLKLNNWVREALGARPSSSAAYNRLMEATDRFNRAALGCPKRLDGIESPNQCHPEVGTFNAKYWDEAKKAASEFAASKD